MKFSSTIALAFISLCSWVVIPSAQAQTPVIDPNKAPLTPAATSNNWKDFPDIGTGFMQGCIGEQVLPAAQKKIRQNFCQCAFTSYKNRYTPKVFMQMNSLAVQIGPNGPLLVSLMMKPEVDRCSVQTGYRP
jgi:hypothetical protein